MVPMSALTPFADGIWTVSAPQSMMGLHLGSRMTVVRLSGGGLLLHSPVPIDDALARSIDALGPVEHVVAPNLFHHLHAGAALSRWPGARSYAPEGLGKKRPDLRIDARFSEDAPLPFAGELEPLTIRGCQLGETVLFHGRTGTVISSDLSENFKTMDHLPTRLYLKASGVYGKPGWSRLLRFVYDDRKAARESIDRLLRWDFDRAVIAHGEPFTAGAKAAIVQTFEWL
jgi:hypothetical protein